MSVTLTTTPVAQVPYEACGEKGEWESVPEVVPRCQALCPRQLARSEVASARTLSTGVNSQAMVLKVEKLAQTTTSFPLP